MDCPLCPGMWEHVKLCTKKFKKPSTKADYTIWPVWHIVNPIGNLATIDNWQRQLWQQATAVANASNGRQRLLLQRQLQGGAKATVMVGNSGQRQLQRRVMAYSSRAGDGHFDGEWQPLQWRATATPTASGDRFHGGGRPLRHGRGTVVMVCLRFHVTGGGVGIKLLKFALPFFWRVKIA
jgi:hypothetical protein